MTTIDNLDISVYNLYAIRTKMIEQTNQQLRLEEAANIPPHTLVIDLYPKMTELDILLGVVPLHTPWAYFFPPKTKNEGMRRSPFAFFRVAPTLGSLEDQANQFETIEKTSCKNAEEQREKDIIKECFAQIEKINGWLGFIMGRIGQFLQG